MVVETAIGEVERHTTGEATGCNGGDVGGVAWIRVGAKLVLFSFSYFLI
jgi:hypothetical protein